MVLNYIFDPIFQPLIEFNIAFAVILISFLLALIMTFIYKWMTDQNLMKTLKSELKEFQSEIKQLKDRPNEAMKVQKRMMDTNMKYMIHSLRPTLVTFLPIILIFGWLSSHLAYIPIYPNTEFTTTIELDNGAKGDVTLITPSDVGIIDQSVKPVGAQVTWTLIGLEGEYSIEYLVNGNKYTKDLLITNAQDYLEPIKKVKDGTVRQISINHQPLIVFNFLGRDEGGFFTGRWGWLGTYIIFSIIFSMSLRRLLKLH